MSEQSSAGNGAYQVITPPNKLKAKVGLSKGIDSKMLERAQALVDGMSGDFVERAAEEAGNILTLADSTGDDKADDRVVQIFRIGHELKGQGGTFGYPLISTIGGSLCRYIESVADHKRVDLEIVRAHALALRAVAVNRITGEGGTIEKQILGELNRLLKKELSA